jgi:hypothetical protein
MQIPTEQIEKKKKIGRLRGEDVWHVKLKGGLHIVAGPHGKIHAFGPHRAVALHISKKKEPDIEFTELSKSDHINPADFQDIIPKYEELTDRARALQGK